jgi:hypothetical protein
VLKQQSHTVEEYKLRAPFSQLAGGSLHSSCACQKTGYNQFDIELVGAKNGLPVSARTFKLKTFQSFEAKIRCKLRSYVIIH